MSTKRENSRSVARPDPSARFDPMEIALLRISRARPKRSEGGKPSVRSYTRTASLRARCSTTSSRMYREYLTSLRPSRVPCSTTPVCSKLVARRRQTCCLLLVACRLSPLHHIDKAPARLRGPGLCSVSSRRLSLRKRTRTRRVRGWERCRDRRRRHIRRRRS